MHEEGRELARVLLMVSMIGWPGMTVYVAGAMTGLPGFNFPAFEAATACLRGLGASVVSPPEIALALGFDPADPEARPELLPAILAAELDALLDCDAVILLDGWETSAGTAVELDVADALGLPAVELIDLRRAEVIVAA